MGLLDAAIHHLYQDRRILMKLYHQLLSLLHLPEGIFVNNVGVMEEEVILRCQLDLNILNVVLVVALHTSQSMLSLPTLAP